MYQIYLYGFNSIPIYGTDEKLYYIVDRLDDMQNQVRYINTLKMSACSPQDIQNEINSIAAERSRGVREGLPPTLCFWIKNKNIERVQYFSGHHSLDLIYDLKAPDYAGPEANPVFNENFRWRHVISLERPADN